MDVTDLMRLARVRRLVASGEARDILQRAHVSESDAARTIGVSAAAVNRWHSCQRTPTGAAALRYEALLRQLALLVSSEQAS